MPPSVSLPPDLPQEAIPYLQDVGYLDPDRLGVGDIPPDLPLFTLDCEPRRLSSCWATVEQPPLVHSSAPPLVRSSAPPLRPLAVLIFGSYT